MKSGMHHPDGMLWIARPEGRSEPAAAPERVSLRRVAPTLLELMEMTPPVQMLEGLPVAKKLAAC